MSRSFQRLATRLLMLLAAFSIPTISFAQESSATDPTPASLQEATPSGTTDLALQQSKIAENTLKRLLGENALRRNGSKDS